MLEVASSMLDEIVRYPVKSMQGEAVLASSVGESGLVGDRRWAVRDRVTGHLASAKHARQFGPLLSCRARYDDDPLAAPTITVPGGEPAVAGDPDLDARLASLLGRSVELVDADHCHRVIGRVDPTGDDREFDGTQLTDPTTSELGGGIPGAPSLVDYAAIHIVARSTLEHLAEEIGEDAAAPARFRANFVVDVDIPPFGENDWVGRAVMIGGVALTVIAPTPRCVVPTLPLPEHGPSPATMRGLAARNRPQVLDLGPRTSLGAYAQVTRAGTVRHGDSVAVADTPAHESS